MLKYHALKLDLMPVMFISWENTFIKRITHQTLGPPTACLWPSRREHCEQPATGARVCMCSRKVAPKSPPLCNPSSSFFVLLIMGTAQSTLSWDDLVDRGHKQLLRQDYNEIKAKVSQRDKPIYYHEFCHVFLRRRTLPEDVKRKIFSLCCKSNKNYVDSELFLRTLCMIRFGKLKVLRQIFGGLVPLKFEFDDGYWVDREDAFPDECELITLITNLEADDLERVQDFFEANSKDGLAVKRDFERLMFPACSSSIISGWFNMADLLGCEKVSRLEFVLAISSISQGPPEECLKNMARIWDQGNKGYLDVNDVMLLYNDLNIPAEYRTLHTLPNERITFVDFQMWVTDAPFLKSTVLKKLLVICNICLGAPVSIAQRNQEQTFDKMLDILAEATLDDYSEWTLVPIGWPERAITAIGLGNLLPPLNMRDIIHSDDTRSEYDYVVTLVPNLNIGSECLAVPSAWLRTLYATNRQRMPRTIERRTVKMSDLPPDFDWPETWHEKEPNARVFLDLYPVAGLFNIETDAVKREFFKFVHVDRTRPIVEMVEEWVDDETRLGAFPFRVVFVESDKVKLQYMEIDEHMCIADLECETFCLFDVIVDTRGKEEKVEESVSSKHAATTPTVSTAPRFGTGLTNRNRECYINSVLQCLSNAHSFKQIAPESYLRSVERHRPHLFSEALRTVLMDLWAASKDYTSADRLKRLFREKHSHMDDDQDQDAHEALEFILEMVHDELKTTNKPEITNNDADVENNNLIVSQGLTAWAKHIAENVSFITHSFDGLTGSEIQCRKCNFVSPSFETFRSFNVTLQHDTSLHVRFFYANDSQTNFTERSIVVPQNYTTTDLKREIAKEQGVPEEKLYLHLPNMRNETAVGNSEYLMVKVAPLSEREQLVVYELPSSDAKLTPRVCLQRSIQMHYSIIASRVDTYTVDILAIPLMFQVPEKITGAGFYKMVNDYIQRIKAIYPIKPGRQMNRAIIDIEKTKELPFHLVYTEQNGEWCSRCHWLNYCRGCLIPNDGTQVDLNTNFTIQWKPAPYILYMHHLYMALVTLDDSKESRRKNSDGKIVSLESALSGTLHPEILDTPFTCDGCNEKCFFQKRLYFVHTPTTLVINLQRFALAERGWVKDKRHVTFPLVDFDMAPYFGPGFKPDGLYECIAFIVHIGELHTGHYISYYKKNDTWYLCNDEKVTTVPLSQVEFHNASVLFYQQQDLVPHPVLVSEEVVVSASPEDFVVPEDPDHGFATEESKDEHVVPQTSRPNVTPEKSKLNVTPEKSRLNVTPEKSETTSSLLSVTPEKSETDSSLLSVTPEKLDNGDKTPEKSEDGPVTPEKSEDGPVTPEKTEDGPVIPEKSEDGPVTTEKTEDGPVIPEKSEDGPVIPEKSENGPVTPEKSEDGPVIPEKSENEAVVAEKPESQAEVAEESKNQAVAADVLDNQAVNHDESMDEGVDVD
uniref:ubiquitinyl hydrolase 1 n=1 Tax=Panagrellus redivivus TaxID=6233 RepID=A0A7E4WCZ7_PANRE